MTQYLAATVGLVVGVVVGAAGTTYVSQHRAPVLTTGYQAVFLTNGAMFFGRLQDPGSPYPVMRDVHTLQSTTNPDTKQVTTALLRRSQGLHQPDATILNARQIMFIEPVNPDSQIAKAIDQESAPPKPSAPPDAAPPAAPK